MNDEPTDEIECSACRRGYGAHACGLPATKLIGIDQAAPGTESQHADILVVTQKTKDPDPFIQTMEEVQAIEDKKLLEQAKVKKVQSITINGKEIPVENITISPKASRKQLARMFAQSTVRSAYATQCKIQHTDKVKVSIEEILNEYDFLTICLGEFMRALAKQGIHQGYHPLTKMKMAVKIVKIARPMFSTIYNINMAKTTQGFDKLVYKSRNFEVTL